MLKDLIIFEKAYTFTLWIFTASNKFPKNQRFTLGQQLCNQSLAKRLDDPRLADFG
jgi:hypothetical protein